MVEWQPIILSIKVAFTALVFVAIFGVSLAYIMRHGSFPGKAAVEAFCTLPLVLPPVGGSALFCYF